jgi:hypothetical protein
VDSARDLSKGSVYFTIVYCDEGMKYPSVGAYVYLGSGLVGSTESKHYFQTTDSYHDAGNWSAMSHEERQRLGPEAVISCEAKDVGDLVKNVNELIAELAGFRSKWHTGS